RMLAFETGRGEVVLWEPGKDKATHHLPRPPHRRDDPTYNTPNEMPTNFAFTPDSKAFLRRAGALRRLSRAPGGGGEVAAARRQGRTGTPRGAEGEAGAGEAAAD